MNSFNYIFSMEQYLSLLVKSQEQACNFIPLKEQTLRSILLCLGQSVFPTQCAEYPLRPLNDCSSLSDKVVSSHLFGRNRVVIKFYDLLSKLYEVTVELCLVSLSPRAHLGRGVCAYRSYLLMPDMNMDVLQNRIRQSLFPI